ADIDRFTTLDACVTQHALIDPLIGDAVDAIGYETFVRDSCRTLLAAKTMDGRRCDPIASPSLEDRCRMLVAVLARDPDSCPLHASNKPELGREPSCLAVAANDARICAAADTSRRPWCEALAMRDERRCEARFTDNERASCRRELARWS